ncbi:protein enabled isoform X1 [Microplitis demolitor]|uniref:protein enabled isoform X1 n=1 Tax=Microplitis demolitor TaxID=69319 RepID=UPI0004CD1C5D|nr:protein enabled isoform X1 [Microplitis demolitor]
MVGEKSKSNIIYYECHKGLVNTNRVVDRLPNRRPVHVRPVTVHGGEANKNENNTEDLRQIRSHHSRQYSWQESWMCEVSISSARASVMVYDDVNKRWIPSGSSSGLSKVQLYHHVVHNTFRVVGRKLQDHEIVINCAILKGLKYNQATGTFHQWRDNNQVYGLNFSSKDDADAFARAMLQALDVLSNGSNISRSLVPAGTPAGQQQTVYPQQPQQQPTQANAQYEEDMGYRTMTREDVAIIQERRMSQQSQSSNGPNAVSPSCPSVNPQSQQQQPVQQQPQQSGHHRTSSAPPAPQPQPPPMPGAMIIRPQIPGPPAPPPQPPAAPPAPPCPPAMMNINAPVPPPMINQYAQSSSQTNVIANQPNSQPQNIYGNNNINNQNNNQANNNNQYSSTQSNQYASNSNVCQSQYSSQSSLYGSNNQNYSQSNNAISVAPGSQYASSQNSQYAVAGNNVAVAGNNQYGSNSSINQYASSPNQFVQQQQQQAQVSQYGVVGPVAQGQYAGQNANNVVNNPYGTPANSVNQYATGPAVNANAYPPVGSNGPPPPPMGPLVGPAAPPPPPPPPAPNADATKSAQGTNNTNSSVPESAPDVNSLAAALQAARLKKKQQQAQSAENSPSSGGGGGNYGTLGRGGGGGMASMMDEMAKTLARRRAAVEKKQPEQPPEPENSPDKKWDKNNANNKFSNGAESPKSARKRFGSASEDTLLRVNGVNDGALLTAQEMEAFKAEIIKEVRKEFQKMKQEIIDALKGELNRR